MDGEVGRYCQIGQDHGLDKALDRKMLLELAAAGAGTRRKGQGHLPIRNINRVVGTSRQRGDPPLRPRRFAG